MNIKQLAELRQNFDVLNNQRNPDGGELNRAWEAYRKGVAAMDISLAEADRQTWEYMSNAE